MIALTEKEKSWGDSTAVAVFCAIVCIIIAVLVVNAKPIETNQPSDQNTIGDQNLPTENLLLEKDLTLSWIHGAIDLPIHRVIVLPIGDQAEASPLGFHIYLQRTTISSVLNCF